MYFLENYYSNYDEEGRLLRRHGQVEYLTTMHYINEILKGDKSKRIFSVPSNLLFKISKLCSTSSNASTSYPSFAKVTL